VKVGSGVPQGSVSSPASFVTFVNDLPDAVSSKIYMFADVTKMSKGTVSDADRELLQSDIKNLVKWPTAQKFPFNSTKCKVMSLGTNQTTSNYIVALTNSTITDIAKCVLKMDLGILIHKELTLTDHINMVTKKANGIMAVIRSFTCTDFKCFNLLYKSLMRPHSEHGVIAQFPYIMKDIIIHSEPLKTWHFISDYNFG